MDIAEALGPERLRELMTDLVNRCAGVVRRYGGTLNQFTGDGIMALFGAPKTLEDHARRACLAALDIQTQTQHLAAEVARRDSTTLQLRVGINSGLVIAGDIGSAPIAYTAMGQHVGLAQRMEAVSQPGGVMLSQSTVRLVENYFALGEPQFVRIKGADDLVPARRLLSVAAERRLDRRDARLVGREAEMRKIATVMNRSLGGRGSIVAVSGPPGIGKTRLVRESVSAATSDGCQVFTTYCESHTREISFHVISRLLRTVFGIGGLTPEEARPRVRSGIDQASDEDLLLLDELLGIRDADVPLSDISPDARRRRLIELINSVSLARTAPAVYVIEDAHWIDGVSESMLTDLAVTVFDMRATMLITYRPEYRGTLSQLAGAESIVLAPLSDSHISDLLAELLGADASVGNLTTVVANRAAGIPFCAEELVRDLAERGDLEGGPGAYVCTREVGDVQVPPTLQAAIGARIDRLTPTAKRTLNAAAVIGARFGAELLERLLDSTDLGPLIEAKLIDQVVIGDEVEYAFHHPLTQKVAYESQLRSARSDLHRRAAAVMQQAAAADTGEGAAMIATQYQAAGDLQQSYDWYMRAATAYGTRDIRAARRSWELARTVADRLSIDDPGRIEMQIAPRSMLCGSAFQVGGTPETTGFDELRDLTDAAGDKRSLAVGMAGHITTLTFNSRHREASVMGSEFATLVESIGDPEMTVGLLYAAGQAKWEAGEAVESLRVANLMIDLADGDPTMGNFLISSPLAWATMVKGAARMFLGQQGWREDVEKGIELARAFDPNTRALAQLYRYAASTQNGAVLPTEVDIACTTEFVEIARQSGDNTAVTFSYINSASTLLHCPAGDRAAGLAALATAREMLDREKLTMTLRRMTDIEFARDFALNGDLDRAIDLSRTVLREQFDTGEMIFRGPATTVLVEALLSRGSPVDVDAARRAVDALDTVPTDPGFMLHELPVLRLRALLARECRDGVGYREFVARFRQKALAADFEGYLAQAEAMV
jgi:adenylate cyclase